MIEEEYPIIRLDTINERREEKNEINANRRILLRSCWELSATMEYQKRVKPPRIQSRSEKVISPRILSQSDGVTVNRASKQAVMLAACVTFAGDMGTAFRNIRASGRLLRISGLVDMDGSITSISGIEAGPWASR